MFLKLLITATLIGLTILWWQWRTRLRNRPPTEGELTLAQAYAVLGLSTPCRRDDIIQSHRRLMANLHPDKGGSNFLAAQLNAARQKLLQVHPD